MWGFCARTTNTARRVIKWASSASDSETALSDPGILLLRRFQLRRPFLGLGVGVRRLEGGGFAVQSMVEVRQQRQQATTIVGIFGGGWVNYKLQSSHAAEHSWLVWTDSHGRRTERERCFSPGRHTSLISTFSRCRRLRQTNRHQPLRSTRSVVHRLPRSLRHPSRARPP